MEFATVMQVIQTASIILAMVVAIGTIRGRGADKTTVLTKMQLDIDYIKKAIDCIPTQSETLVKLEESCKSAHKRMDEHLKYDHKQKGE